MKIFEVGVMRTGTTSLGRAYEILGFNHRGCNHVLNNKFNKERDYNMLFNVIDKYDAFQDVPWQSIDVQILDKKYPGSKFILLERDDESWIRSLEYWSSPALNKDWEEWIEPDRALVDERWVIDRDNLIKEHLEWKYSKYEKIKEYFRDRKDDLLVMNICDGEGWEVLCSFLNISIPRVGLNVSFPKVNVWASNFDINDIY
jgi:hypothetical protein